MYIFSEINPLFLIIVLVLWGLGGWLIVSRLFSIEPQERGLVGLGVGVIVANWLANLLGHFLSPQVAFWGSAVLVLTIGAALAWPIRRDLCPPGSIQPLQWGIFLGLFFLFTVIGRGLGIFDDYQNLPPVSTLAAGDIPPHTAFDPRLRFGYHYFQLLLGAQFVRMLDTGPWVALDVARGLLIALTLSLTGLLAWRMTGSKLVALLSGFFAAFAGGARWILLLLPASLLNQLSNSINLIGSGAVSGPDLATVLYKAWKIEGSGPVPFPFVYGSGLDPSISMAHTGFGASAIVIGLLLLFLVERRQHFGANAILVVLLASLALANEVTFGFLYIGLAFAGLAWVMYKRTLRFPRELWGWVIILALGGIVSLFQGGMMTELARGAFERMTTGSDNTLYKVGFSLAPPAVLSAHLGELPLTNPLYWPAILAETGLAVLALPWIFGFFLREAREERWLTAAWAASIIPSMLIVFFDYTGNAGPTAISRMVAHFGLVTKLYAVPLLWLWAREKSDEIQGGLLAWGAASVFSGVALFGIQLQAAPTPIYGEFLTHLDAQFFQKYWDITEKDSMVFDENYLRGITITGRPAIAALNFGTVLPEWEALAIRPDPYDLKAAGYDYLLYDRKFGELHSELINQPCVKLVAEVTEQNDAGKTTDYRRLVKISTCQ